MENSVDGFGSEQRKRFLKQRGVEIWNELSSRPGQRRLTDSLKPVLDEIYQHRNINPKRNNVASLVILLFLCSPL